MILDHVNKLDNGADTCDMVFIEPQVVSDFVAKLLNLYQHMSSPSGRKKHLTQKVLTDEEVLKVSLNFI